MSLARVPLIIKSFFAALLLFLPSLLMAQSIQVSDFSFDEMDITANTSGTEVIDPNNGKKCALIKVHTTQKGFTFDVGMLGVTKVVEQNTTHPTEIWVYVPQGVKRLSITHPQLGELRDYDLGRTLQSSKTYHLTLQTGTLQTVINPSLQKQFAVFTLVPPNASLEVDGEAWEVNAQGQAARQLPFGTYQYRATAPRYKPTSGQFTVGKEKHTETITLTPNFSTITFQAPAGSEVWVDGERRGTGTCQVELTAGEYQVECRQESHLATSKVVTVAANQPRTITLDAPRPIYGLLSVSSTPFGAEVTVDGKVVGETPLSLDNVLIGNRQVAVSLNGYDTPAAKTVFVSQEQDAAVDFQLTKSVSTHSFTVNGVTFLMVPVEGGTFTMGATSEQGSDAEKDEKPVHQVTLSSFNIGQTEVTQELWQAVMGSNPSHFKGNKHPVDYVKWEDCQTFIQKLNEMTGQQFRLPTEAEWEFAARGGNMSQGYKYAGDNFLSSVVWYENNSRYSTHDVATKSPNELGLYDMSGNVCEWCQDWYGDYDSSAQTNPKGPSSGSARVGRGGRWNSSASCCRVAYRDGIAPTSARNFIGFRLAL